MLSKLLFISLFLVSCGNEVKIKSNQLENIDPLTDAQVASYQKSGVFTKGNPSKIQYQGRTYNISVYSSKVTQDFISAAPSGTQIPVYFTGGVDGSQVVVETIKRQ